VRVGVVGTGSFGRNHVRILSQLAGARLVGVYDRRPWVAAAVAAEHGTKACESLAELESACDAVVLAVPTALHAEVGVGLLERGRHLLVEKPIAASLVDADRLLEAAGDRVLAVGHVEYFNPAVETLLGMRLAPGFIEIQRRSGFSPRSLDIDVVLDLMIHDLQILHAMDPSPVREIRATGVPVLSDRTDIANVRIAFESGCVANLTASRVSAERERKLRGFFHRSYYSLDYAEQEIKGYRLVEDDDGGRTIVADDPAVARAEPLQRELEGFVAHCASGAGRVADGEQGRRALQTALWINEIIREDLDARRAARGEGT
jgi:predicted dehydrogenase